MIAGICNDVFILIQSPTKMPPASLWACFPACFLAKGWDKALADLVTLKSNYLFATIFKDNVLHK